MKPPTLVVATGELDDGTYGTLIAVDGDPRLMTPAAAIKYAVALIRVGMTAEYAAKVIAQPRHPTVEFALSADSLLDPLGSLPVRTAGIVTHPTRYVPYVDDAGRPLVDITREHPDDDDLGGELVTVGTVNAHDLIRLGCQTILVSIGADLDDHYLRILDDVPGLEHTEARELVDAVDIDVDLR